MASERSSSRVDQFSGVFISVDMILPSCSVSTTVAAIFIVMLLFPSSLRPRPDIFPGSKRLYSREAGIVREEVRDGIFIIQSKRDY